MTTDAKTPELAAVVARVRERAEFQQPYLNKDDKAAIEMLCAAAERVGALDTHVAALEVAVRKERDAQAELAALRAERDLLEEKIEQTERITPEEVECLHADEIAALRERLADAAKALRPFTDLLERGYDEQGFLRRYCEAAKVAYLAARTPGAIRVDRSFREKEPTR